MNSHKTSFRKVVSSLMLLWNGAPKVFAPTVCTSSNVLVWQGLLNYFTHSWAIHLEYDNRSACVWTNKTDPHLPPKPRVLCYSYSMYINSTCLNIKKAPSAVFKPLPPFRWTLVASMSHSFITWLLRHNGFCEGILGRHSWPFSRFFSEHEK